MNSEETENIEKEVMDIEKLVDMLRHIHSDVENMRRDVAVLMHKVDGVAFLHEISRHSVEEAINVFDVNLDEIYSPIDKKDREEWHKHLESENLERLKREGILKDI